MRNISALLFGCVLLSGSAAWAQTAPVSPVALPGSFWVSAGDVGPATPRSVGESTADFGVPVTYMSSGIPDVDSAFGYGHLDGNRGVEPENFREYRIRVITEKLEAMPDLVDRLYKRYAE